MIGTTYRRGARAAARSMLAMTLIMTTMIAAAQQAAPASPPPGGRQSGLNQERLDELSHKHDGFYGALAPQNLAKLRPKPPFDMTGTWFIDLRKSFNDFKFGPPYPEFYAPGQTAMKESAAGLEKPWKQTLTYKRNREWELVEFICAENDRNPVGEDGHTQFK